MEYAQSMKVGSLFSGIGGLDLGLERAGMDVIWQSEIDPYACKVLNKHWPTVPNLGNIKEIDWSQVERPDVICGGYPCQPFSTAGKRQGEGDARHLWPWVRECIAELRPRYAVLENVRGHLSLGFGTVLGDLATIGYDTEWQVIPAAAVGAPHRRDRVFIVAYPKSVGGNGRKNRDNSISISARQEMGVKTRAISGNVADTDNARGRTSRSRIDRDRAQAVKGRNNKSQSGTSRRSADVADTDSIGLEGQRAEQSAAGIGRSGQTVADNEFIRDGQHRLTTDVAGEGGQRDNHQRGEAADVIGQWWAIEPNVGRVAHGIPNRVDRLRCLGNAVVPQVAEYVGRLIMAAQ